MDSDWLTTDFKKSLLSNRKIIPLVERVLIKDNIDNDIARDRLHFHPSSICKRDWCPRSSWYDAKGYDRPAEAHSFNKLNIFAEGHAIHDKWQDWLKRAGILKGRWSCDECGNPWVSTSPDSCPHCHSLRFRYTEVPIRNDDFNILGHADGIIVLDKEYILEIKSVGIGTVRMEDYEMFMEYQNGGKSIDELWKSIRRPFASHLRQVNLYMYCLDIKDAIILYEWKPTQDVKEFHVKYQPEMVEDILSACAMLTRAVESSVPPLRPTWVESSSSKVCKTCPYKAVCWKDDNETDTTESNK